MEAALIAIRSMWKSVVELALEAKREFQDDADEAMSFFNGPYDFLYGLTDAAQRGDFVVSHKKRAIPAPSIAMTVNKVAEGVQLFGPSLYHKNPICLVNPRKPPDIPLGVFGNLQDPMTQMMVMPLIQQLNQASEVDKMRAALLEAELNYMPNATDLKSNMRDCIDQGIITGGGVLWHEVYRPVGSKHRLVGAFYDTVDNLVVDPDHDSMDYAKWVARRFCEPVWEVELKFGLPHGTLKGNYQSSSQSAVEEIGDEYRRKTGKTNDLLVYWQVWSKMGLGALLRGISKDAADADRFGRYVQLSFCENYKYPLNLPPSIWGNEAEMYRRVQWETPFWADDGWPFDFLAFHRVPNSVWPMSHFKPGMGMLKFLNWSYSFLASRMQKSSRSIVAILKAAGEEFKAKILDGTDFEFVELEASLGKSIGDIVSFLNHPEVNGDFIAFIGMIERAFERSTGLNELLYGESSRQYRSAAEAEVKQSNLNIRPDDMANKVEDFATNVFRKMAMMSRWHLDASDITPVFGVPVANLWQTYVATADVSSIVHQLEYRIEAGSAKKPNKQKQQDDAKEMMQTMFAPLFQYGMTSGNVGPVNALIQMAGKANDIDVSQMTLAPPPMMPPPGQEAPGASPPAPGSSTPSPPSIAG